MVRIFNFDYENRIYRVRGDSGQNEVERFNAYISEVLVDGGVM